ncbi:MAG: glycosyltransferase family 4 protein [Planctomycetota bacterium]
MLLISREYPPFVGGGIGTYTVRMARTLAAAGRAATVVTVGHDAEPTREHAGGIAVVRLPFIALGNAGGGSKLEGSELEGAEPDWSAPHPAIRTPATLAAFWAFHRESVFAMQIREHLPALLDEFEPEAIEAPDTGAALWFILNDRRLGRGPLAERGVDGPPVIVHLHSPTAWIEELQGGPQPGRAAAELRSMERDVLRWADGVASPSRMLAEWTAAWEPAVEGRVCVTPYPLGRPVDAEAPRASGDAALFVGRMERRKGFGTLTEAIAMLRSADRSCPVVRVAGRDTEDWVTGGPFGNKVLARLGLGGDAIELLGELESAALAAERTRCPIALVPSPNDNFPNTCMEAMAAGQIVVAANAGGMAEMIEDGTSGVLFAPGDAASLADAIERAATMAAGQRDAMAAAARHRIATLCEDARVLARRTEHAAGCRPRLPTPAPDRNVAIINASRASEPQHEQLRAALRANAGVDAVIPWTSRTNADGEAVEACSTPAADRAELLPAHAGPIATTLALAERLPGAARVDAGWIAADSTAALRWLLDQGARVAVLPEVVVGSAGDADDRPGVPVVQRLGELEGLANARWHEIDAVRRRADALAADLERTRRELAEIRSSRAYGLARRLSALRRRLLGG